MIPRTHRGYVGFGEDERGEVGMVAATSNERLPEIQTWRASECFSWKPPAETSYVNLPDISSLR